MERDIVPCYYKNPASIEKQQVIVLSLYITRRSTWNTVTYR